MVESMEARKIFLIIEMRNARPKQIRNVTEILGGKI